MLGGVFKYEAFKDQRTIDPLSVVTVMVGVGIESVPEIAAFVPDSGNNIESIGLTIHPIVSNSTPPWTTFGCSRLLCEPRIHAQTARRQDKTLPLPLLPIKPAA